MRRLIVRLRKWWMSQCKYWHSMGFSYSGPGSKADGRGLIGDYFVCRVCKRRIYKTPDIQGRYYKMPGEP